MGKIFECISEVILVMDVNEKIVMVNEIFMEVIGYII